MVVTVEVKAVEGGQQPQVDTGDPHQHSVLETLGQIRIGCVPRAIPVLRQREKTNQQGQVNNDFDLESPAGVDC